MDQVHLVDIVSPDDYTGSPEVGACGCEQVFGLGFVSVFDQVLEGLPEGDKGKLFSAYLDALGEDSAQYRQVHHLTCLIWLLVQQCLRTKQLAHSM